MCGAVLKGDERVYGRVASLTKNSKRWHWHFMDDVWLLLSAGFLGLMRG